MPLFGPALFGAAGNVLGAVAKSAGVKLPGQPTRKRRRKRTLSQREKNDILFLKSIGARGAITTYLGGRGM